MKEEYRTDEQLQALLSEFKVINPEMQCDQGNRINRFCMNPKCQNHSLICQEKQCQKCGEKNHIRCINLQLEGLTQIVSERVLKQKHFISGICKIQNRLVDQLYKSSRALTKNYCLGNIKQQYFNIFEEIYMKKNTKCVTGQKAKSFYKMLVQSNDRASQHAASLLEDYQKSINSIIELMLKLKNNLYQCFGNITEPQVHHLGEIDSKIIQDPLSFNQALPKCYDSLIIKHFHHLANELKKEQTQFLIQSLNYPKRFQLLFRASENSFRAATFHQKCDNVRNTLTILRTEFGKTIAGFTNYTWNQANGWVHDEGRHAFLLSLDLKQKILPVSNNNLIYCAKSYGPYFGEDIQITDQCHKNESCANFPSQYNCEGDKRYTNNQESYKAFSGAKSSNRFRVVQYEVFRVVYQ